MTTNLETGIAKYLATQNLVRYDEVNTSGDCFIEHVPQQPDAVVVLTAYPGPEPDALLGYDEPQLQIRVRGTADPRVSRARAMGIFDALHGLAGVTLADGLVLIDCIATTSGPQSMGRDGNNRYEHVLNFRLEVRNTSGGRRQ